MAINPPPRNSVKFVGMKLFNVIPLPHNAALCGNLGAPASKFSVAAPCYVLSVATP
jgi:hypothetical protein